MPTDDVKYQSMPTDAYNMPTTCLQRPLNMPNDAYRCLQVPTDAYRCLQMPIDVYNMLTDAYTMHTPWLKMTVDAYICLQMPTTCLQMPTAGLQHA